MAFIYTFGRADPGTCISRRAKEWLRSSKATPGNGLVPDPSSKSKPRTTLMGDAADEVADLDAAG